MGQLRRRILNYNKNNVVMLMVVNNERVFLADRSVLNFIIFNIILMQRQFYIIKATCVEF